MLYYFPNVSFYMQNKTLYPREIKYVILQRHEIHYIKKHTYEKDNAVMDSDKEKRSFRSFLEGIKMYGNLDFSIKLTQSLRRLCILIFKRTFVIYEKEYL